MPRRLLPILTLLLALLLAACTTKTATPEIPPQGEEPTALPADDQTQPTEAPAPQPGGEPAVLISEVLTGIEGNNNFEFIELTNTSTEAPFDLKGWSLWYMERKYG